MSVSDLLSLAMAALGGALLGFAYFIALWRTVAGLPTARRPGRLLVLSASARVVGTLGGFYALADRDWRRWLLALAGFMLARVVALRRARRLSAAEAPT